jgi:hypothetical protein
MKLADYDTILVNSSAGKDSQAMLTEVVSMAATWAGSNGRGLWISPALRPSSTGSPSPR